MASLVSGNPTTSRDVLELTAYPAGFGHLFIAAMMAIDLARQKGLRFVLEDNYWDGQPSRRPDNYSSWAWSLSPVFRRASEVRKETRRWTDASMSAIRYSDMLRKECSVAGSAPVWYRVDVASNTACRGAAPRTRVGWFCTELLPGVLERSLASFMHSEALRLPPSVGPNAAIQTRSSGRVRAVWHIRTGDYHTRVSERAMLALSRLLVQSFPRRGIEHYVLTYNSSGLKNRVPTFMNMVKRNPESRVSSDKETVLDDLAEMANAEVLVGTGSSLSIAASAFAPVGQLHLPFPPQVIPLFGVHPGVPTISRLPGYRANYISRNTVPISAAGEPFSGGYRNKLHLMAAAIDNGGRAGLDVASLAFEDWLTNNTSTSIRGKACVT